MPSGKPDSRPKRDRNGAAPVDKREQASSMPFILRALRRPPYWTPDFLRDRCANFIGDFALLQHAIASVTTDRSDSIDE